MPFNILIVGAGVCGPAFASLLQGSDHRHNITIVERSSSLRLAGQQIDLKFQGMPLLAKMGLEEAVKAQCVDETGLEVVNEKGKPIAHFGIGGSTEKSSFTLTSEFEIMRGDLVTVLYEASLEQRAKLDQEHGKHGSLAYNFGMSITALCQRSNGVDVTFSNGQTGRYDLVVGADGQASRTRRLAFGPEVSDKAFKSIGVHSALFTIPRSENDGGLARMLSANKSRYIMTRTSNRPTTQAYFFTMNPGALKDSYKQPIERQKELWAEAFRDAGWESERILEGLAACDDFYAYEVGQVHMEQHYIGRTVLLGDSGYCPSPFTGLGTTLSLIGSYVLAGELARHEDDLDQALKEYERLMGPPIAEYQKMPSSFGIFFPSSQIGVWALRNVMWGVSYMISRFKLDQKWSKWFPEADSEWKLPHYTELKLKS